MSTRIRVTIKGYNSWWYRGQGQLPEGMGAPVIIVLKLKLMYMVDFMVALCELRTLILPTSIPCIL